MGGGLGAGLQILPCSVGVSGGDVWLGCRGMILVGIGGAGMGGASGIACRAVLVESVLPSATRGTGVSVWEDLLTWCGM